MNESIENIRKLSKARRELRTMAGAPQLFIQISTMANKSGDLLNPTKIELGLVADTSDLIDVLIYHCQMREDFWFEQLKEEKAQIENFMETEYCNENHNV